MDWMPKCEEQHRVELKNGEGEQHNQQEPLGDLATNVSFLFFQSATLHGVLSQAVKR